MVISMGVLLNIVLLEQEQHGLSSGHMRSFKSLFLGFQVKLRHCIMLSQVPRGYMFKQK